MNGKKSVKEPTVEYYEKVGVGNFVKSLIITLTLVFGAIGLVSWNNVSPLFAVVITFTWISTVSIMYAIFGNLMITITSNELVVAFRFFNQKRFVLSDIELCEQTRTNVKKYYGAGIRYGTDGSLAYSTSFGSAVRITKVGERPFVFSTNNPETVCQIISTKNR